MFIMSPNFSSLLQVTFLSINPPNRCFPKPASTYTFFEVGSYGANVNLDNVRGLGFEIIHDDKDIYWDRKHWGVVRFPEIELR